MTTSTQSGGANFLQGASNIRINGPVTAIAIAQQESFNSLQLLEAEVAPKAILHAGGGVEVVGCYPGTRKEVISQTEKWIDSGHREDRRIFWLSGPAGAGKSAIMHTIAENCIRHIPMATFFFVRADGTRNHSRPLVATILRQLVKLFPDMKSIVNEIIRQDSLVYETSLRNQFMTLLDAPVRALRRCAPEQPIVLLIDGLDECDPRPELDSATKFEQVNLLNALHTLVTPSDSSFIALIASRADSHIEMAFNRIGRGKHSIYLSEDYRPDVDIRFYITAELADIKRAHPLGQHLDEEWPPDSIIDSIVAKSSGQFLYPSTVTRFVANSSQSPAFSMDMVLNVRPVQKRSPFADIDAMYLFILGRCEHWHVVRDILAVAAIHGSDDYLEMKSFGYSQHEGPSFFSDLTSIIKATVLAGQIKLQFHHASFQDFIHDPLRAGRFHIDLVGCANRLAPILILNISDTGTSLVAAKVLGQVAERSRALTDAIMGHPVIPAEYSEEGKAVLKSFYEQKIKELYSQHEEEPYKLICIALDRWFNPGVHPALENEQGEPLADAAQAAIQTRGKNRTCKPRKFWRWCKQKIRHSN